MPLDGRRWTGSGPGRRRGRTGPDQHAAVFIYRQALAVDQLILERFEVCLVELELQLEGAIGQAAAPLEQGDGLIQYLLKGHGSPFPLLGCLQTLQYPYRGFLALPIILLFANRTR